MLAIGLISLFILVRSKSTFLTSWNTFTVVLPHVGQLTSVGTLFLSPKDFNKYLQAFISSIGDSEREIRIVSPIFSDRSGARATVDLIIASLLI